MDQLTLEGIDPGIVDTGFVALTLNRRTKTFGYKYRYWTDVSETNKGVTVLKPEFIATLQQEHRLLRDKSQFVAIEGYRPRGKSMRKDQQMTTIISGIH